ncbi:unnamed protein product [Cochlearia groenlandica]
MAEEEIRESVSKAKEENLSLPRAIPSNQDGEYDTKFMEIVLDVVDALRHFPRQPPSAPAIPSARRRAMVRVFSSLFLYGKKIETRSTNGNWD